MAKQTKLKFNLSKSEIDHIFVMDDFSRSIWIFLMKGKEEVGNLIIQFFYGWKSFQKMRFTQSKPKMVVSFRMLIWMISSKLTDAFIKYLVVTLHSKITR